MRAFSLSIMLLLSACATPPKLSSDNGFVTGQEYTTNTTLFAIQWGERAELVSHYRTKSDKSGPNNVRAVPAGTRIAITVIRGDNTLTRGVDQWPEGEILNGKMAGTRISMNAPDLINFLTRVQ